SADPDDDPGGAPRRPAACSRRRRRLRAAPPARHRDRRRADLQPDADPLHHAGHLSLSGTLPGILRGFAAKQTAAADRGFGVKKMCRATVPIVLAWVLPWLSACSVGPDYARPALKTPPAYKESPAAAESRAIDDVITRKWWEIFADPQLNALEEQVEVSNQNIAQAEARFRQARALVQQTRAAYFPTVTVGAGITRIAPSATAGSSTARANQTFTERSLPVDVSWELDLWGRIRRSVESSRALAQASEADLEAARLSARAELAQDYFALRSLDGQKRILDDTAVALEKSLQLTENRYRSGVASRGDVLQAQTLLKTTQAQAIDVGVQRAQLEHAIALLIGKAPADLSIAPAALAAAPPDLPAGVPAQLLKRRPDVASAERTLASANAQIGVAE